MENTQGSKFPFGQDVERDYVEDICNPNGHYMHMCPHCNEQFAGHKHRWTCKKCYISQLENRCTDIRKETLEDIAERISLLPPLPDGPVYDTRMNGHEDAYRLVISMLDK